MDVSLWWVGVIFLSYKQLTHLFQETYHPGQKFFWGIWGFGDLGKWGNGVVGEWGSDGGTGEWGNGVIG
jgi:hypothetical protein